MNCDEFDRTNKLTKGKDFSLKYLDAARIQLMPMKDPLKKWMEKNDAFERH